MRARSVLVPFLLCAAVAACDIGAVEEEEDLELGEETQAVESYFCVDHPCPDLKPRRYSECFRWGNMMPLRVENIGAATAGGSTALFELDYYGYERNYSVPSLAPGAGYLLWVALPTQCTSGPGCVWFLHADTTNVVTEINGSNNTVWGACIN